MTSPEILIIALDHGFNEEIVNNHLPQLMENNNVPIYWEKFTRNLNNNILYLGLEDSLNIALYNLTIFYLGLQEIEQYDSVFTGIGHRENRERAKTTTIPKESLIAARGAQAILILRTVPNQLNHEIMNILTQIDTQELIQQRHNISYVYEFNQKLISLLSELIDLMRQNPYYTSFIDLDQLIALLNTAYAGRIADMRMFLRKLRDKSNALYILKDLYQRNLFKAIIAVGGAHVEHLTEYLQDMGAEVTSYMKQNLSTSEIENVIDGFLN